MLMTNSVLQGGDYTRMKMKKTMKLLLIFACFTALLACDPLDVDPDDGIDILDPAYGAVEFDFTLPEVGVPVKNIHRVDLSLARSLDSLYRKDFCSAANVSDYKQKYRFTLLPGRYFYQAGVTCTCQGDSCLYGGFPGGQLSVWWTSGWVDVEKGKVFSKELNFQ